MQQPVHAPGVATSARGVRGSVAALGDTLRSPDLRRVQLAWVGSVLGTWAYLVALAVYAYEQGGPAAVGIVGLVKLVPAALLAPFVAGLADRYSRKVVMVGTDVVRCVLFAACAAVIAVDGPAPVVYALVAVATVVGTAFRPAQAALLPALARSPAELTGANVASSFWEAIGKVVGPALGGLLLAVSNVEIVFLANAASFAWSAALVALVRISGERPQESGMPVGLFGSGALEGFRVIGRDRRLGLVVALYAAQTLVAGAFVGVLIVVSVLELLELEESAVGWMNAMLGVGGVVGGVAALALAARRRLGGDLGAGLVLYGAPVVALGLVPEPWVAVLALAAVGIGNSLVDVSAMTLIQRLAPDEAMSRVFGVNQSVILANLGLGAVLAPVLVETIGVRSSLIVTGAILPALVLLAWPRLIRIDAPPPARLELLRRVPFFAPLREPVLERLARALDEVRVAAGNTVFRAGEPGDRFYVVEQGEVEIAGKTFGSGESFGEIALLRDVPRTQTVTARSDVVLQAIERDEFVAAGDGPRTCACGGRRRHRSPAWNRRKRGGARLVRSV
jgi:MFS family permease